MVFGLELLEGCFLNCDHIFKIYGVCVCVCVNVRFLRKTILKLCTLCSACLKGLLSILNININDICLMYSTNCHFYVTCVTMAAERAIKT